MPVIPPTLHTDLSQGPSTTCCSLVKPPEYKETNLLATAVTSSNLAVGPVVAVAPVVAAAAAAAVVAAGYSSTETGLGTLHLGLDKPYAVPMAVAAAADV